jgi:Mrp family chromosome partitioning ATPase
MAMLIATARADFDWVIVDTPPAGLITDAGVLEGSLDGFLLIVAAGRTPHHLVRHAITTLGSERILGVILNRTQRARGLEGDSYAPYHLGGRRSA